MISPTTGLKFVKKEFYLYRDVVALYLELKLQLHHSCLRFLQKHRFRIFDINCVYDCQAVERANNFQECPSANSVCDTILDPFGATSRHLYNGPLWCFDISEVSSPKFKKCEAHATFYGFLTWLAALYSRNFGQNKTTTSLGPTLPAALMTKKHRSLSHSTSDLSDHTSHSPCWTN